MDENRTPVGIFDKNGHGYCFKCGQDVMEEDFSHYDYESVDCEICNARPGYEDYEA